MVLFQSKTLFINTDVEYNGISMVELNVEDVFHQYPDLAEFNKMGK